MKHKEYIIPIGEEAKEFDEIFIGVIRKQPELIRCKDCKRCQNSTVLTCGKPKEIFYCDGARKMLVESYDYCSWAERKEE